MTLSCMLWFVMFGPPSSLPPKVPGIMPVRGEVAGSKHDILHGKNMGSLSL